VGFFSAAGEVIGIPSFEVALDELARHKQALRLLTGPKNICIAK
jgi:hypothetical protein